MLQVESALWLSPLVLLVPLALAAQRQPRREGPKPPRSPSKHSSWKFLLLAAGLAVAAVGLTLGGRFAFRQLTGSPPSPADVVRGVPGGSEPKEGLSPWSVRDVLGETWWTDLTRVCPRLAALDRSGAEPASTLLVQLVTVECLSQVCEHPGKLEVVRPAEFSRLKPMCERLSPLMEGRMREETWNYRFSCPEAVGAWADRPWTPSNHLGFYKEARGCLERLCMDDEVSGAEAQVHCKVAAALAESFGDKQAVPRLRARARVVRERGERELQGLSPEERAAREKVELERIRKASVRRLGEACRKGLQQYCHAVTQYCQKEGHPPDVCPSPPSAPAAQDAGPR